MTREPTFESTAIRRQFSEIANLINDDLTVYLIGGGALTLEELKNATKDVDLIVRRESELTQLWNVLTSAGYEPQEDLAEEYDELETAFILEKDRRRFDCEVQNSTAVSTPRVSVRDLRGLPTHLNESIPI